MKIGVTGTRNGATNFQIERIIDFFKSITEPIELHHGDCIGVDEQVALIAKECGGKVICHPPIKPELRAFFKSDEYRTVATHFQRNRNIVNETSLLLVVPNSTEWQPRGGTWYTHDYAKKHNRPYIIFWPE